MSPKTAHVAVKDPASVGSILAALEAEYRAYRKAADRFHAQAEKRFETLRSAVAKLGRPGQAAAQKPNNKPLSKREAQILQLIAEGNGTKQAAEAMGIAFKTAVGHRSKLMAKLDVHDVVSLTRYAIRAGLIEP